VIHRRILGRPTFGRSEINSYFDTAARQGFYGVIDAMLASREYNDCFGEDCVPYERFITAMDLNARRIPTFRQPLKTSGQVVSAPVVRPQVDQPKPFRGSGDLTPRNLPDRRLAPVVGGWTAAINGEESLGTVATTSAPSQSLRQPPKPTRRWRASSN